MQAGRQGYSDLHTYQYLPNRANAKKFLIVQCKRVGHENRELVWGQAINQLNRYLSSTHGIRPLGSRTPVYGIVAIGKLLRVYKYQDIHQQVSEWYPSGIPFRPDMGYNIQVHERVVQRILNFIRRNH